MLRLIVIVVLTGLGSNAFAEAQPETKSPSIAVGLSLGTTAAGMITLIAADQSTTRWIGLGALYFGPSTGLWYAGKTGGLGLATRAAGAASAIYGFSLLLKSENDCEEELDGDCSAANAREDRFKGIGMAMMLGGVALWGASTIADIVLAKQATDDWNKRHALRIAPTMFPTQGQHAPGVALSGTF